VTRRKSERFKINEVLTTIDKASLDRFMDIFIAGITTIPYFKAIKMDDQYYLEGGYTDNTPLRSLFENPEVEEIIAVDFTDYDFHAELDKIYRQNPLMLALNGIEMNLLVNNLQWNLPNSAVLSQAVFINQLLQSLNQPSLEVAGKTYTYKPLHILKPKNLESMTVALEDVTAQKDYFKVGQQEIEAAVQQPGFLKGE
jgi:predicted acylesterase/phospholipase RssA